MKGLVLEKCRFMDSKKLPLWLAFENVEPNVQPVNVIFKVCIFLYSIRIYVYVYVYVYCFMCQVCMFMFYVYIF